MAASTRTIGFHAGPAYASSANALQLGRMVLCKLNFLLNETTTAPTEHCNWNFLIDKPNH